MAFSSTSLEQYRSLLDSISVRYLIRSIHRGRGSPRAPMVHHCRTATRQPPLRCRLDNLIMEVYHFQTSRTCSSQFSLPACTFKPASSTTPTEEISSASRTGPWSVRGLGNCRDAAEPRPAAFENPFITFCVHQLNESHHRIE
ncbi:hypothetical protein J6590_030465 [Homalodisca vitripennis]|nr:hypothetical protein J6590_030465 [Homalodisca vitripennis]